MKRYLVAWSGGLDSTYLVYKLLKEGHSVTAVYIKIINNEGKTKMEELAIEKMKEIFTRMAREREWKFSIEHSSAQVGHNNACNYRIKQFPIFCYGLLGCVNENIDEVAMAYVMNDDAMSYMDEFRAIWDSYTPLLQKAVPLVFPLSKHNKYEIYNDLPTEFKEHIWVCENPINNKPCGECCPCKRAAREYLPNRIVSDYPDYKESDVLNNYFVDNLCTDNNYDFHVFRNKYNIITNRKDEILPTPLPQLPRI